MPYQFVAQTFILLCHSNMDGDERDIMSIPDDDGHWTLARENNVSSEQIWNHISSSSVNEKLLNIGAIPGANPNKFEVIVEDDEDESLDGHIEIGDESELTMRSDETEEEFQKRVE